MLSDLFEAYRQRHNEALREVLERKTASYDSFKTSFVYASLFDLCKNSARYSSYNTDEVTLNLMKIA